MKKWTKPEIKKISIVKVTQSGSSAGPENPNNPQSHKKAP